MNCKQLLLSSLLLANSAIGTGYAAESIKAAGQDSDLAEARQYLDYSKPFPWFPAMVAAISPEQRAAMGKLRAMPQYNPCTLAPKRSATTAATMDELERRVDETLALKADAETGALTGRALVDTGDRVPSEPDKTKPANYITDFYLLFDVAFRAYEASLPAGKGTPSGEADAASVRAATLLSRLLTHFANQTWDGIRSGGKILDPGYGYIWVKDVGKEINARAPITLTLKGRWRLTDDMNPKSATAQPAPSGVDTLLVVAASVPAGNVVRLVLN